MYFLIFIIDLIEHSYTLLEIAVDLAAQYCKNLQYNTTFVQYSKILEFILHSG